MVVQQDSIVMWFLVVEIYCRTTQNHLKSLCSPARRVKCGGQLMKNKGDQINQVGLFSPKMFFCQIDLFAYPTTYGVIVKPLYSGHPWDVANWLLHKGGLIILCTFNREVLLGHY